MRAVRIALVIAGLLLAAAEVGARVTPPPFSRVSIGRVDTAKAEMLRDPAHAMQEAERARLLAHGIGDPGQRALALATADWLRGEGASRPASMRPRRRRSPVRCTRRAKGHRSPTFTAISCCPPGGWIPMAGRIADALSTYQGAYRIFQHLNDMRGQARALVQIANLYLDAKDYVSALRYLEQARAIYRGDDSLRMVILNNRSVTLSELGRVDDALDQLRDAAASPGR